MLRALVVLIDDLQVRTLATRVLTDAGLSIASVGEAPGWMDAPEGAVLVLGPELSLDDLRQLGAEIHLRRPDLCILLLVSQAKVRENTSRGYWTFDNHGALETVLVWDRRGCRTELVQFISRLLGREEPTRRPLEYSRRPPWTLG